MFFSFFPLAENTTAAAMQPRRPALLPMLPVPLQRAEMQREESFADAVSYAGIFSTDLLRKLIGLLTSSLTTLGSRASEFFSYISAWLAFDRVARQAHSMMTMGFQAFGLPAPQPAYAGLPAPFFPFAPCLNPAFGAGAALDPAAAFANWFTPWMNVWAPAKPAQVYRSPLRETAPLAFVFSMPGFAWSVSAG